MLSSKKMRELFNLVRSHYILLFFLVAQPPHDFPGKPLTSLLSKFSGESFFVVLLFLVWISHAFACNLRKKGKREEKSEDVAIKFFLHFHFLLIHYSYILLSFSFSSFLDSGLLLSLLSWHVHKLRCLCTKCSWQEKKRVTVTIKNIVFWWYYPR